jgi:transmembrane protein 222
MRMSVPKIEKSSTLEINEEVYLNEASSLRKAFTWEHAIPRLPTRSTTSTSSTSSLSFDIEKSRFPYCIVWTPIPMITWFFPFIGHTGITDSRGVIYDFAGPYTISVDDLSFGKPCRIIRLRPELVKSKSSQTNNLTISESTSLSLSSQQQRLWDISVDISCEVYSGRMHNICCDNCHSHVCKALNEMEYLGIKSWNMITLACWIFFYGEYVSYRRAINMWLPFIIIVSIFLGIFVRAK